MMAVSANRLFRLLVAAAVVLHLVLWLVPAAGGGWLDGFRGWLLDFDGYGADIRYTPVLYWCLFASWLLILAGLFFYVAAARSGFLALTGISIVLSSYWGVRVFAPREAALDTLLAVIDGALIAMAYFSPVRTEFQRQR